MHLYKFEISANDFHLRTHFSTGEQAGLENCRRYMTKFQKQVANVQMKVVVSEREKQKEYWQYHGQPFLYKKTLIKKPLIKKDGP